MTYLECLRALAQQTEQIRAAAAAEDWDQVLAGLEGRQGLMNRIDGLAQSDRTLTDEGRATAGRLLDHVTQQDGELTLLLGAGAAAIKAELEESDRVKETLSAYRKMARSNPHAHLARFVDTQR